VNAFKSLLFSIGRWWDTYKFVISLGLFGGALGEAIVLAYSGTLWGVFPLASGAFLVWFMYDRVQANAGKAQRTPECISQHRIDLAREEYFNLPSVRCLAVQVQFGLEPERE